MSIIKYNVPYLTGKEKNYIGEAISKKSFSGDGPFTKKCQEWLENDTGCYKALITHSCTAALEMAAILADIQPGDEVIMPSYTFVSTANAFVLRGGVPVFVDIRSDTLNIDESLIEDAITSRTKVIVPVHYAGVSCEMKTIMDIAKKYNLLVIEDAAQGILSRYHDRPLGSIGHMGCYSFHETKNISSGEGGALLINDPKLAERAEIIREKGTNRSKFLQGQVDKYSWVDLGSSFLPSEITAAFLWAQLLEARSITERRQSIWVNYNESFKSIEEIGRARRPVIPESCNSNAHIYYLILEDQNDRNRFIEAMAKQKINCTFHYVPLHKSDYGERYAKNNVKYTVTEIMADRLVRLPLWIGMESQQESIIRIISSFLDKDNKIQKE